MTPTDRHRGDAPTVPLPVTDGAPRRARRASLLAAGVLLAAVAATAAVAHAAAPPAGPHPAAAAPVHASWAPHPTRGGRPVDPRSLAPRATRTVTLRPVDASGRLRPGWTAVAEAGHADDVCDRVSPAATSPGMVACGPDADVLDTCWPTATARVLQCLRDPFGRTLVTVTVGSVRAPLPPAAAAAPLGLDLADGSQCRLRDGGAWSAPADHLDWVGYYSCRLHGAFAPYSLYAALPAHGSSDGIDRSTPTFTVWEGGADRASRQVAVTTVRYAGTA